MTKFLNWLKNYEILFSTVSSTFLSIMAIIVSYYSIKVTKDQAQISVFENMPDFKIDQVYLLNPETSIAEDLEIRLHKQSGKAKNISVQHKSFVSIIISDSLYNRGKFKMLLNDYYVMSQSVSNDTQFRRIFKKGNNIRASNFHKFLDSILAPSGREVLQFTPYTVVKISYVDFRNEYQEEYYYVERGDNGVLINNKDSKLISDLENWIEYFKQGQILELSDSDDYTNPKSIQVLKTALLDNNIE